jgi:hypothetical protein
MNASGVSLAETLAVTTLIGLAISVSIPATQELRSRSRMRSATRELALSLQALRWRSVSTNQGHGLWFEQGPEGWTWVVVRDENGNGIRAAELSSGIDSKVSEPRPVGRIGSGVRLGIPPGDPIPRIPPARGTLEGSGDPIRFGNSDLIAFSPLGSASSGTLYLTDSTGALSAIVVFGATARVRIYRFSRTRAVWTR